MLQEIGGKQGARGIVNLPPGHLKSTLARLWAAWMLGRSPDEKIMVLSCSEGLAREFADGVRTTMKVPWYCELFPETRIKHGRGSLMDFLTTRGGGLLASPMGADITGRRADLLIVDDPVDLRHANDEERLAKANEYFDREIMSRLNSRRRGRVLVVAHRIHENDVSGHCLRNGGYAHLSLPFITEVDVVHRWRNVEWFREAGGLLRPDAFSDRDVEEIRRAPEFPALWQQNPGGSLGALIGPEHFGSFDRRELPAGPVVLSIDPGLTPGPKSSYTVMQAWRSVDGYRYLLGQWRERVEVDEALRVLKRTCSWFSPNLVLIEKTGFGPALILACQAKVNIEPIVPDGRSKSERLLEHEDLIRAGRIKLRAGAPWAAEYVAEFRDPKDQVDASTQAWHWFAMNATPPTPRVKRSWGCKVGPSGVIIANAQTSPPQWYQQGQGHALTWSRPKPIAPAWM